MPSPDPALQVHRLAPHDIDANALPRDRTALDPTALAELETSILLNGLRQPIEVFALAPPPGTGPRYGLISGLRRLTVMRRIGAPTIAAFLRTPADATAAMADMIAENEIRADITPWERATIVLAAIDQGHFETVDTALPRLYPAYDKTRRSRLRGVIEVVQHFGPTLTGPLTLSQQKLTRLATGLRAGLGDVMSTALAESSDTSPATQWSLLAAILDEHDHDTRHGSPIYRQGRPRRYVRMARSLVLRREKTRDGWILRFTGRDAKGPLMEDIMDYVEDFLGTR